MRGEDEAYAAEHLAGLAMLGKDKIVAVLVLIILLPANERRGGYVNMLGAPIVTDEGANLLPILLLAELELIRGEATLETSL
jgi:hypothetical protein